MEELENICIYTDGGSRGNPGSAAIGVVILMKKKKILKEYKQCIGKTTNNVAEYQAVIFALKKVKLLFGKDKIKDLEVEIKSDSELLINQLNGKYKISALEIQELFMTLWNLKIGFGKIKFTSISREQNREADKLVNDALDGK